jgi:signal transduction histidine kinase
VLRVSDEGVGIPPEIAERMLEPCFTTKLDEGGPGLGLTITNSILKEHGGELVCESRPGKGTTFIVRLPTAESRN